MAKEQPFIPQPGQANLPFTSNIVLAPGGSIVKNGFLRSSTFKTGESGWTIDANGNVEFNNGVFRGAIAASTIDIGGFDSTSFHVDINGNMWLGSASFATATFRVTNTGILEAGDLSGNPGSQSVEIDGASGEFISYLDGVPRAVIGAGGIQFNAPLGGNGGSVSSFGGSNLTFLLGDGSDTAGELDFDIISAGVGELKPGGDGEISLGIASKRWADVQSVLINGADYGFDNGWWITESYKIGIEEDGLAFLNDRNELRLFIGAKHLYVPAHMQDIADLKYIQRDVKERVKIKKPHGNN